MPALIQLDKSPQALINHLKALKTVRLGLRFEALVAYWLMISPNYKLLSKNIQIIENGITLGEVDFIIEDLNSKKIIHLEVAVKFYLGTSPYENPYRWFGTNTKDQLGRKLDHLKHHQTQLGKKYNNHFQYEINEQHCLIKGRLFYPLGGGKPPNGVATNHLRGSWCYSNRMNNKDNLIPVSKLDWLAELSHSDIVDMNDFEKKSAHQAQCFVKIQNNEQELKEEIRIFCLPDDFTFPK